MLRRGESEGRSVWSESLLISDFSELTALLVNGRRRMNGRTMMSSERSFNDHLFLSTHSLSIAFYSCSLTSHSAT